MISLEEIREYCLQKKGVSESFPFGPETLVFKVLNKAFLLTGVDSEELHFNAKMDPERIPEYRERYDGVEPGYHMNKAHWNTVYPHRNIPLKEVYGMIDHSYEQVIKGMTKKDREMLMKQK